VSSLYYYRRAKAATAERDTGGGGVLVVPVCFHLFGEDEKHKSMLLPFTLGFRYRDSRRE
jgi:hypothetical protein